MDDQRKTWIFVSHASADIDTVREVRNYLEAKGASPLLFHLMALTAPEEFWPLIEREIQARSFFLYCESPAAEESEWVRRERQAVEIARRSSPKRISHLRIDRGRFARRTLDEFLRQTIVFPIFDRADADAVQPFLETLAEAGFHILPNTQTKSHTQKAMRGGWTVIFLSERSMGGSSIQRDIQRAKIDRNAKVLTVLLDGAEIGFSWRQLLAGIVLLNAVPDQITAPARLAAELLEQPFER